jgi:predicted enzyme related to lactoylglutathione lyase
MRPSLAFKPDDLDGAIERIRARGGSATESPESSGHGRWLECTDDQGTPFALYAPTGD